MSSTQSPENGSAPVAALPLFYRDPQPLNANVHAGWRLKAGDAGFASETAYVPVVTGEIAAATRFYPVVFAGEGQPIALTGLEQVNLFVENGQWAADTYVPAYVRRYPFGFIQTVNPDGFILAIDSASERVAKEGSEGAALFEDGKPSDITKQALEFSNAFQAEAAQTKAFAEALKAQSLLIDRRADATLPDGRKLGLDGFQIVDAEKFAALEDAVVLDWHRKGWLALVHFHLASLAHFQNLLNRQATRAGKTVPETAGA